MLLLLFWCCFGVVVLLLLPDSFVVVGSWCRCHCRHRFPAFFFLSCSEYCLLGSLICNFESTVQLLQDIATN
jgi:hypothetical protein